jgi:hypothetical protein
MGARPAHIQRARLEGNTDLLKAAGRQGGLAAAEKKRRTKDIDSLYAERAAERSEADEHFRMQQSGEDILPPSLYE